MNEKRNKMSDYVSAREKENLALIGIVAVFFVCFFIWFFLDTDRAENIGLNLPRLVYFFANPIFSIIYGCCSCKMTSKVLLPNVIFLVANLLFIALAFVCMGKDAEEALYGLFIGVPLSLICALITKLVVYLTKHFKKKKLEKERDDLSF